MDEDFIYHRLPFEVLSITDYQSTAGVMSEDQRLLHQYLTMKFLL